ncbi:SDC1 [Candida theae]|uniref:SDC1 n=1 Tax=Candida theae TaxID=1198502 RepID=A0AAD5BDT4_9ASCO|nr:SDC1 [Candida theae]KAI5957735.1 SDC1 [Candida theae]
MNISDIVQEKEGTPVVNGDAAGQEAANTQVKQELAPLQVPPQEPPQEPPIKQEVNGTPRGTTPTPQLQTKQVKQEPISRDTNLPPLQEIVGGSSIRRYLNQHLTQHLLDGLKEVGQVKPEDPLKYLGEFLIGRSNEERQSSKSDN